MTYNFPFYPVTRKTFRPHCSYDGYISDLHQNGYTPKELKKLTGFDIDSDASGITIAVISALDNSSAVADTLKFCRTFSLNEPDISVFFPSGKAPSTTERWYIEACLDLQWVSVFAPRAKILAVFTENPFIDTMLSAVDFAKENGAEIITMCFGTEEGADAMEKSKVFNDKGHIFVASSGDEGGIISFPSVCQNVVSVGGFDFLGDRTTAVRLIASPQSGGGASQIFRAPEYQKIFNPVSEMTKGKRGTPDVCFYSGTSHGAAVCVNGKWKTAGGTSLACACISGICGCIAKKNSDILQQGICNYFYEQAGKYGYDVPQYMFYDVILGKSGKFYAEKGWDFCTGLGLPSSKFISTKKEP